ncbi:hypothetical protein [Paenibacillus turpanensis]|uniref:hypothetical protein n=1 Tax=Paenibacillus turpanensis TaxID=2689078 RepID=UPI00140AAB7E|nr:hypothetical protein [Paenibacillus turpanensis]
MAEKKEKKFCIRCFRELGEKEKYCVQCGAPTANRCTYKGGLVGEPCGNVNDPDAVYCSKCGAPTEYRELGLIPGHYEAATRPREEEEDEMQAFNHPFFRHD